LIVRQNFPLAAPDGIYRRQIINQFDAHHLFRRPVAKVALDTQAERRAMTEAGQLVVHAQG